MELTALNRIAHLVVREVFSTNGNAFAVAGPPKASASTPCSSSAIAGWVDVFLDRRAIPALVNRVAASLPRVLPQPHAYSANRYLIQSIR